MLPQWDELTALDANDQDVAPIARECEVLGAKRPALSYQFARLVVRWFLKDPSYRKFLHYGWSDIVKVLSTQIALNGKLSRDKQTHSLAKTISDRNDNALVRPFSQFPCTRQTSERRVQWVETLVNRTSPLLLLGDDDLVSVELADAGFRDVTVIDICPKVLQEIERLTAHHEFKPKLARQDLASPPLELTRPYALVMCDPQYLFQGVELFVGAALKLTGYGQGTLLMLNVHLLSLTRPGLNQLNTWLKAQGFDQVDFKPGFNAYPVPRSMRTLLSAFNKVVLRSKMLQEAASVSCFFSDSVLLKKVRAGAAPAAVATRRAGAEETSFATATREATSP